MEEASVMEPGDVFPLSDSDADLCDEAEEVEATRVLEVVDVEM